MLIPGTRFLIDTSAMSRARHPAVHQLITALIDDGLAAACVTVDLEAGHSARGAEDLRRIREVRQKLFTYLPLTGWAATRANDVQELLAGRGLHRVAGVMDLLTAAVAEEHRATVLHYDADFEHIASVTGQQHRWVVPRGSLP
jgi:predicted nucleic acid-binding protein